MRWPTWRVNFRESGASALAALVVVAALTVGVPASPAYSAGPADLSSIALAESNPGAGVVDLDGLVLAVPHGRSGSVSFHDPVDGALMTVAAATTGADSMPWGVVVGPDGNLLVSDAGAGTVERFNSVTGRHDETFVVGGDVAGVGFRPRGMSVTADGRLLVADGGSKRIRVFDRDGVENDRNRFEEFKLSDPVDVVHLDSETVVVSDRGRDRLERFDAATGAYLGTLAQFEKRTRPSGMVMAPDGRLLVAATRQNAILAVDVESGSYQRLVPEVTRPVGLAVDDANRLWVTSPWIDRVAAYDLATGSALGVQLDVDPLSAPMLIAAVRPGGEDEAGPDVDAEEGRATEEGSGRAIQGGSGRAIQEDSARQRSSTEVEPNLLEAADWVEELAESTPDPDGGATFLSIDRDRSASSSSADLAVLTDDYSVALVDGAAVLVGSGGDATDGDDGDVVVMDVVGRASEPTVELLETSPIVQRPESSAIDSDTEAVEFAEVLPEIDLVYSSDDGDLQYSFVVAPEADPSEIVLTFDGVAAVELDPNGDLRLERSNGAAYLSTAPYTYQQVDGDVVEIDSAYRITTDGQVRFEVGAYDTGLPLVIDPTLRLATTASGVYTSGATIDLPVPSGVVAGELLIAQVAHNTPEATSSITPGAGWTTIDVEGHSSEGLVQGLYWRVATASEPSTYSFTLNHEVDATAAGAIGAFRSVDPTNPVDVWAVQESGPGTSSTAPSVTTTVSAASLVTFHAVRGNGSITPATGMTERWDVASSTGAAASSETLAAAADELLAAPGPSGARVATATSGDGSIAHTVALRPLCITDSDGDGLCDRHEDANTDADDNPATNPGPDTDGDSTVDYLDSDDDGDGVATSAENADPNGDLSPSDARDSDRDGQPDYLDPTTEITGSMVDTELAISDTSGGLVVALDDNDEFGRGVASIGDIDGDGVVDIAVGAQYDDDGGTNRGAVYVLFLNADGTVKGEQKISSTAGGLAATLDDSDIFGLAVAGIGDLDGDGVPDLAVGAAGDDDGGAERGAVYVLFLNADGTVKDEQKISSTAGGLSGLGDWDWFGSGVAGLGDLDGDGLVDIAASAILDDDGGGSRGAVYVLFLNADGTAKGQQKISETSGGFGTGLQDGDSLGASLAAVGDVDGDGRIDLVAGAFSDDGGVDRGAVYVILLNADGTVKSKQKISSAAGGLTTTFNASDLFGYSVAGLGDLDTDGYIDIAVGAINVDDVCCDSGAVVIIELNTDGTVRSEQKISGTDGGLGPVLNGGDVFGTAVSGLGDTDGDGTIGLVVGARLDDDGGPDRGAVWILDLTSNVDTDGDGLFDLAEDADSDSDSDPATNPGPDTDGDTTPDYLDADDDGDGTATSAENADPNGDGDPRDAFDRDRDRQPDYLDAPAVETGTVVAAEQKISDTAGGLAAVLVDSDEFGRGVTSIGDLDGDGVTDLAVGASGDDDGGSGRGAVYVLFMNGDGTVKGEQKISATTGGLTGPLNDFDSFGSAVAGIGDLDGDGLMELAVGALGDDDGGANQGGVHVLFLNPDGTVRAEQKLSETAGGLSIALDGNDYFGWRLTGPGDVNGDGVADLLIGAPLDDDGGTDRGAAYLVFLNPDGTAQGEQKISDTAGGFTATIDNVDWIGVGVAGLGDVDGDGIVDIALGAAADDDGGSAQGAIYIVFLNADGTVKGHQKISETTGGLSAALDASDWFGYSATGLGDLDGDGYIDLAVGSYQDDDGGSGTGAVYLLELNADGTVRSEQKISETTGGITGPLTADGRFGSELAAIGDLDGDGTIGLAVAASRDDDGGTNRGAVWILDLAPAAITVNSTGSGGDNNAGDHACSTGGLNSQGAPECTLRAAIQEANASSAISRIEFDIPTTDGGYNAGSPAYWRIGATAGFDWISSPLVIDATTQPGWTDTPIVELDGNAFTGGVDGVVFTTDDSTLKGLSITNFPDEGVDIDGDRITIADNWIGIDPTGSPAGNGSTDLLIRSGADHMIGGATSADGNRFAASGADVGIVASSGGTDIQIRHNTFGLGGDGVTSTAPPRNAIYLAGSTTGTVIHGNRFANMGHSPVDSWGSGTLVVTGNIFGLDETGAPAPIGHRAIWLAGTGNVRIGGTGAGEGNIIANTGLDGVTLNNTSVVSLLGNSIYSTSEVGFDIDEDGYTANDAGDGDTGFNDLLNHPEITSIGGLGGAVDFDLDVPAGTYRVEFFVNSAVGSSADYHGETFVHATTVTHAGSGRQSFSTSFTVLAGASLTATTTQDLGGGSFGATSEYSASVAYCFSDADGDGLCDTSEDANTDLDGDPATNPGPDTDGDTTPDYLDADDDGDGTPTSAENADPNGDNQPKDAVDSDFDGQPDYLDLPLAQATPAVAAEQLISDTVGGFTATIDNSDELGRAVASVGDIDGDGVVDLAAAAQFDDDGGPNRGAIYVSFMNADGTVKSHQKISSTTGGLTGLGDYDQFGRGVAGLGDIDGDGIGDIAVGSPGDDDGGASRGAVYVLFMNADGTVKSQQKISETTGGLVETLGDNDYLGWGVAATGDLDGDGGPDMAVTAVGDDDGGSSRSAVYILLLNSDGTVKAEQKISDTQGGFNGVLSNFDYFGSDLTTVGDLDSDGVPDLALGAHGDDDGHIDRGAVWILFMNADGTVKGEQKISDTAGNLTTALETNDYFGYSVAGLGDVDQDGYIELAVGSTGNNGSGGSGADQGVIYILDLNTDGTVRSEHVLGNGNGITGPISNGDLFGSSIAALGDLDGNGRASIVVGSRRDDDGGTDRGALWVMEFADADLTVNSTGDGTDANPGDYICSTGATNTQGATECTLRAAIAEANAAPALRTINFDIPTTESGHSGGVWTISTGSALPTITASVTVDGSTQAGYATPVVAIDGTSQGSGGGLNLSGDDITVVGLNIRSMPGDGIYISGARAAIADNHIGTDAAGAAAAGNGTEGIEIAGPDAVVSGNVVSANSGTAGVVVGDAGDRLRLVGNHVGTDATGAVALANSAEGIELSGADDVIIGEPGNGNVLAGNGNAGLSGWSMTPSGTVVQANKIGVGADGVTSIPNGTSIAEGGITIRTSAQDWLIGGTATGEGNLIANNFGAGVQLATVNGTADDIAIVGNTIYDNSGLAIDFHEDGVTANDSGDGDTGINGRLNFPVITSVTGAALTTIEFDLDVPAGDYRVEVFTNDEADASGNGPGQTLIDEVSLSHPGGSQTYTTTFNTASGTVLTATATEDLGGGTYGSTSEFSAAVAFCADGDGDGLCASFEVLYGDTDGDTVGNEADADDDGDGTATSAENADPNGDGDPRDAVDSDHDGQPDWIDQPTTASPGTVGGQQKVSDTVGGLAAVIDDWDRFGSSVASIGDLDRDGVVDVAAGARQDDDGGSNRGAVYILFLNPDGSVKGEQKISHTEGGLSSTALADADYFGWSVAGIGDLDGDGLGDLAVGAYEDDDGGSGRGSVYILFLNGDGTVKGEQKISDTEGGFVTALGNHDRFGHAVAGLGDIDGDGVVDLAVTADGDDDGGDTRGAVYILFLNPDGTVKGEQKISDTVGGLAATLDNSDRFGHALSGLGDLDGDGIGDMAVGVRYDDDEGSNRGAVYILFLNSDGTVKGEQKISDTVGGLTASLDDSDWFGASVAAIGDLDLDGVTDILVGAATDDDGGSDYGAVYVLFLNSDGTVKDEQKISDQRGGFSAAMDSSDNLGFAVAGLGDLNGNGTVGVAISARSDDDGGSGRGALYFLDLAPPAVTVTVNSTADSSDANPGDGSCYTGANNSESNPECTLRAAIEENNATVTATIIEFDIPTSDPGYSTGPTAFTFTPASAYPSLIRPAEVDGTTQSQYTDRPVVVLDGTSAGSGADGLEFLAGTDDSAVKSLAIHSFDQMGVRVDDSFGFAITGSLVGLDVDGTTARGNRYGMYTDTAPNLIIGGSTAADRNVFSANDWGVAVYNDSTDAVVTGNYFGTDITGLLDRGNNRDGLFIVNNSARPRIGGSTAGEANVFAANGDSGVYLTPGSGSAAEIRGNYFNVGSDGTTPLANDMGLEVASGTGVQVVANTFGPARSAMQLTNSDQSVIQGNFIGTDSTGTESWAYTEAAVVVGSGVDDALIGGTVVGEGNTVTNGVTGIELASVAGSGNSIIGNTIYANTGPGIDLGADGVTANDAGDVDTGANDLLNRPPISVSIETAANTLTSTVELDVPAGTYRVELFRASTSDTIDDSGTGEGHELLGAGSVTHTGSGVETFTIVHPGDAGDLISATATVDLGGGDFGSTSEFSRARTALTTAQVEVNDTGDAADLSAGDGVCDTGAVNAEGEAACTLRAAIEETNAAAAVDSILFDIPTGDSGHSGGVWSIAPASSLATVGVDATIDGTTQPGWAAGSGTPVIELDGAAAGAGVNGLTIGNAAVTIRGLSIGQFLSDGILVQGPATGAVIAGNHIGLDASGLVARGNGGHGVNLTTGSTGVTVGGSSAADRNIVSANSTHGVNLNDADGNTVINNYVGTDVTGLASTAAIGNQSDGISVISGSDNNTIGQVGAGNVVAGNQQRGIRINSASGNVFRANIVGLGQDGDTIVANESYGFLLSSGSASTTIGGSSAGEGNVISGNAISGIRIDGAGGTTTTGNVIAGNIIGLDATGTAARANGDYGIQVASGALTTTVGGPTAAHGNVVSGNTLAGVRVIGSGTNDTVVQHNKIGTNSAGTAAVANGGAGLWVQGDSGEVLDNLISGNTGDGIDIHTATNTEVLRNLVGTDAAGVAAVGNGGDGIEVRGPSSNTIIGSAGNGNVIVANVRIGINLSNESGTVIEANSIGTDSGGTLDLGNTAPGVLVDSGSSGTRIGGTGAGVGNLVANNSLGVKVADGDDVSVLGNQIRDNDGIGIDLVGGTETNNVTANDGGDGDTGPNDLLNFPVIERVERISGFLVTAVSLDAPAGDYRIELFANSTPDGTGNGEGATLLGGSTVTHTGSGEEVFTVTAASAPTALTATATEDLGGGSYGSTSEFSAAVTSPNLIVVNSTGDAVDSSLGDGQCDTGTTNVDGDRECTLRAALAEANDATTGVHTIWFDIPAADPGNGGSWWTIAPASDLPTITDDVTIDATTQSGYSSAPLIAIDASAATGDVLDVDAPATVVGLALADGAGDAIEATAELVVTDSYIGLWPDTSAGGFTGGSRGVVLDGAGAANSVVGRAGEGNRISHMGSHGVVVSQGAHARVESNTITANGGDGVFIADDGATADTAIVGNAISGNGGLAIDLSGGTEDGYGVTANDAGDGDSGPNDLLNSPVINSAVSGGGLLTVEYALDAPAGDYRIEFFSNPGGIDPSGSGELESLLGAATLTHTGGGSQAATAIVAGPDGAVVTATATVDLGGGTLGATSEASSEGSTLTAAEARAIDWSDRRSDLNAAGGLDPASTSPGMAGDALDFNGGANRLIGPGLDLVAGSLTMSAWIRPDGLTGTDRILSKDDSSGSAIYRLAVDGSTGEAVATLGVGAGVTARGGTISAATWHQLAAVWNGTDLVLYVDGVEVDRQAAVGTLATDVDTPVVVGNNATGGAGFDGLIDHVVLRHEAVSVEALAVDRTAAAAGSTLVAVGAQQTGAPSAWTVSGTQTRSGSFALAAPDTPVGAGAAWAVADGIDEPGLSFVSWWWVSDVAAVDLSAGTRAGDVPTDQMEAALVSAAGLALRTRVGDSLSVDAPAAGGPGSGTWVQVEVQTDQDGNSRLLIGGIEVTGWTAQGATPATGSAALRAGLLPVGEDWYVDDARARRLVVPEPTVTVGPLDRN